MVNEPRTNVIKLPNIRSVPQLNAAIGTSGEGLRYSVLPRQPSEQGGKAYQGDLQHYPRQRRDPVLRQGNSDRRAPKAVKEYAKANPHRMGAWNKGSKTHVATMSAGDFRSNEKSTTISIGDVAQLVSSI